MQDPIKIKDAERYGLSPLILYGLTVAGLPIRWMIFTPVLFVRITGQEIADYVAHKSLVMLYLDETEKVVLRPE